MNLLPIELFDNNRMDHHASIGGQVVVAWPDRVAVCELESWKRDGGARVKLHAASLRSVPKRFVIAVVDPATVAP